MRAALGLLRVAGLARGEPLADLEIEWLAAAMPGHFDTTAQAADDLAKDEVFKIAEPARVGGALGPTDGRGYEFRRRP